MGAEAWFYRLMGEEFGPVSMVQLRSQIANGVIGDDDEVRLTEEGPWMPVAQAMLLESFSETESRPTDVVMEIPENWLVSESSAPAIPKSVPVAVTPQDDWYYQVLGQELGPVSFDELHHMAERGELTPDDEVRLGTSGIWRRAGAIGRLQAVMPYQVAKKPAAKKTSKPVSPQEVPSQNSNADAASAEVVPEPVAPQSTSVVEVAEVPPWAYTVWWSAYIAGQEYGPVDANQLQQWGLAGQISATDFIRYLPNGEWQSPSALAGILPTVKQVSVAVAPEPLPAEVQPAVDAQTDSQPDSINLAEEVAQALSEELPSIPDAAPTPVEPKLAERAVETKANPPSPALNDAYEKFFANAAGAKTDPAAKASETSSPAHKKATPKAAATATTSSQEASKKTPPEPPPSKPQLSAVPAPVAQPAPIPVKSTEKPAVATKRSFELPAMPNLGGLGGQMFHPAAMGSLAVILLVAGWYFLPPFNITEAGYYKKQVELLREIKDLRARNGSDADWVALTSKHAPDLKAQEQYLETYASSAYPQRQHLLWNAKFRFKEVLERYRSKMTEAENDIQRNLHQAGTYMGVSGVISAPEPLVIVSETVEPQPPPPGGLP